MSIVCMDPKNCEREHVGGMGGTPVHLPPDGIVVPGLFDNGVPSDVIGEDAIVWRSGLCGRTGTACAQHDDYQAERTEGDDGWCHACGRKIPKGAS